MSNEPGLTLGRLIAAERNSLAAIQQAKVISKRMAVLEEELKKERKENVLLTERVNALNLRVAMLTGSGATQKV